MPADAPVTTATFPFPLTAPGIYPGARCEKLATLSGSAALGGLAECGERAVTGESRECSLLELAGGALGESQLPSRVPKRARLAAAGPEARLDYGTLLVRESSEGRGDGVLLLARQHLVLEVRRALVGEHSDGRVALADGGDGSGCVPR